MARETSKRTMAKCYLGGYMQWLINLWKKLFPPKPIIIIEKQSEKAQEKIEKIGADRWMTIALREKGVMEIPGTKDNPRILEYGKATTYDFTHDEVPWCSAFVNWVFLMAGMTRTKSAGASSWLEWGIPLTKPLYGCVVVKSRTGGNHVTFFIRHENKDGVTGFIGLGGNQGNTVCEMWYPLSTVRGYRWPKEAR